MTHRRLRLMLALPCLVAGIGVLCGCSSIHTEVGDPIYQSTIPMVEGQTTVQEVVDELGPPHELSPVPGGIVFLYEYSYVREFQLGISLKYFRLPYFKLIKSDSNLSETAQVILFDDQGLLRAYDSENWRDKLGGGGALQWVTDVRGLTDTTAFRLVPDQLAWGRASLQRPPVTLNNASDLRLGSNGVQQRISPVFVGQSTLEMARPKPIKLRRKNTRL